MNHKKPETYSPENEIETSFNKLVCDIENDLEKTISISVLSDNLKDKVVRKALNSLPLVSFCEGSQSQVFGLNDSVVQVENIFDFSNDLDEWIRDTAVNDEDYVYGQTFSEISKLYTATLFATINKYQREGEDNEDGSKLADFVKKQYFSISPCLINYVQDLSGQLELLALADRGSVCREFMHTGLLGEICYDSSFADRIDEIKGLADNRDPVNLIHLMQAELGLCTYAMACGDWAYRLIPDIIEAFTDITEKSRVSPLVRLIAEHQIDIVNDINTGAYDQSDLYSKSYLPEFGDKLLINIAPGVYADNSKGRLDYLVDDNNRIANVSDWQPDNEFGIDQDDMFLIQMAHAPGVKVKIESELNVKLEDIKLKTQIEFLRFAIEANDGRYDKLVKILSKTANQSDKMDLIDTFLATEFGDDFGDSILDIVDYAKPNESREVFNLINEYRQVSRVFSDQFNDIDLEFSSGAERAMNERLTDLLAIAAEVAKNGSLTVDTAPHRDNADYQHDGKFDIKIDSLSQVIDTMETFLRSQELMWAIMNSKDTYITERYKKNVDKVYSQTYSLINDKLGIAQFHVRRFGASSFDSVVEHGNYNGTEASISWSVNPNNPFSYPGLKDPDCMNVRFDREGRSIDEAPNSPDRSPIRDDGIVSLDIGSVLGEKTSISTIIGRTIAAGNILRSENNANKSSISLNHNTNYLPQEYGDANNFAWLATMMEQKIVNKYEHINNKKIRKIAKSLVEKSVQIAI